MRKSEPVLLSMVILCAGMFLRSSVCADIGYFRDVVDRRVTTIEDGCKVITIFLKLDEEYPDFNSQMEMLKQRGIVSYNLKRQPSMPLRKGLFAQMVANSLELKGGIITKIFGMSQRYALKECIFLDLMTEENAREIVEGIELIGVVSRMEKYQEEHSSNSHLSPRFTK